MIKHFLTDRCSLLKKQLLISFGMFSPEQVNQMSQEQYEETAGHLKDKIEEALGNGKKIALEIKTLISERITKVTKEYKALIKVDEEPYISLFRSILERVTQRLNILQRRLLRKLYEPNFTSKAGEINKENKEKFLTFAQKLIAAPVSTSSPPTQAQPMYPPKSTYSPKSKPRSVPKPAPAASNKPTSVLASDTESSEKADKKYEITRDFEYQLYLKLQNTLAPQWISENWVTKKAGANNALRPFLREFLRKLTYESTNFKYKEYKNGRESVLAYLTDLIGGEDATNKDNLLKDFVKPSYIAYYAFAENQYEDDIDNIKNTFRIRGAYKGHVELISRFFKQFKLEENGNMTFQGKPILKKYSGSPEIHVRMKLYEDLHDTLHFSKERIQRFVEHHPDDKEADRLVKIAFQRHKEGKEIILDDYEKGLKERFYIDMFRKYKIPPNIWKKLPKLYEKLQTVFVKKKITESDFTTAIRNFAKKTNEYPQLSIVSDGIVNYLGSKGGTVINISKGLADPENVLEASTIFALQQALQSYDFRSLSSVFHFTGEKYLNTPPSISQNLSLLGIDPKLFSQPSKLPGKKFQYEEDWGRFTDLMDPDVYPYQFQKDLVSTLRSFGISLTAVGADVSIQEVFDHAAQFLAQVEGSKFRPDTAKQAPSTYDLGGVKMEYDASKNTPKNLDAYLNKVCLDGGFAYSKKISFIEHLLTLAQTAKTPLSPLMLVELFKEDYKPVKEDDLNLIFTKPHHSIDAYGSFLTMFQAKDGKYVLKYRGKKVNWKIDQTIAGNYFNHCKERTNY